MALRNCDVCTARYGVGDQRNWHDPEHWPQECMDHYRKRHQKHGEAPQAMRDLEPYKAVGIPGQPVIGGRRQHRDELRARGMVEIGNEKVTQKPYEPKGVGEDIKRAIEESGGWH